MPKDAVDIRRVMIACGFMDLRKGIDGLAQIMGSRYDQNPFEKELYSSSSVNDPDNIEVLQPEGERLADPLPYFKEEVHQEKTDVDTGHHDCLHLFFRHHPKGGLGVGSWRRYRFYLFWSAIHSIQGTSICPMRILDKGDKFFRYIVIQFAA